MCHDNIWKRKSKLRKYLSITNKNIAILEHIQEKYNISLSEAVDRVLDNPEEIKMAVEIVKKHYYNFK